MALVDNTDTRSPGELITYDDIGIYDIIMSVTTILSRHAIRKTSYGVRY